MEKYRHWQEQADITVLRADVTLLQLQSISDIDIPFFFSYWYISIFW